MIKVLIVDDSALVRSVLTEIINSAPDMQVVGVAADPLIAREKIKELSPDVLTLDVEMPKMDGVTFLSNLMRLRPMPVVMISSLTDSSAAVTLNALEFGAVDFITKPKIDVRAGLGEYAQEIITKLRMAARAQVRPLVKNKTTEKAPTSTDVIKNYSTTDKLIAIGSSTGGTEAVKDVLLGLPPTIPGIVISQHIPLAFSQSFADRLNALVDLTVCQAEHDQQILTGHVYIAPGDKHLLVRKSGAKYFCELSDGPAVNRHKPSVEVMFRSVAENVGANAIGVMLTGMGADGAIAMKEMRDKGALTIAQDEKTSVVWGMPGEAVKIGAVDTVLPLGQIAGKLIDLSEKRQI